MERQKLFEIVNPVIEAVSLVKRGANKRKFRLIKSENGFERTVTFRKTAAKQIVYGEVYVPGELDSHGDFMRAETIEKMAQQFLRSGLVKNIDTEHDMQPNGSEVVESFIARKGDPNFTEGAWVLGVKVNDPQLWAAVQSGEINGFSMFGTGERVARSEVRKSYVPPPYAQVPPTEAPPVVGSPGDESDAEAHVRRRAEAARASDRYGAYGRPANADADAAIDRHRAAERALGIRKDHSLDGMLADAWRRRSRRSW